MIMLENKGLKKLVKEKGIKDGNPQILWEQHLIQAMSNVATRIHQNSLRGSGNFIILGEHATNILNNYLNE